MTLSPKFLLAWAAAALGAFFAVAAALPPHVSAQGADDKSCMRSELCIGKQYRDFKYLNEKCGTPKITEKKTKTGLVGAPCKETTKENVTTGKCVGYGRCQGTVTKIGKETEKLSDEQKGKTAADKANQDLQQKLKSYNDALNAEDQERGGNQPAPKDGAQPKDAAQPKEPSALSDILNKNYGLDPKAPGNFLERMKTDWPSNFTPVQQALQDIGKNPNGATPVMYNKDGSIANFDQIKNAPSNIPISYQQLMGDPANSPSLMDQAKRALNTFGGYDTNPGDNRSWWDRAQDTYRQLSQWAGDTWQDARQALTGEPATPVESPAPGSGQSDDLLAKLRENEAKYPERYKMDYTEVDKMFAPDESKTAREIQDLRDKIQTLDPLKDAQELSELRKTEAELEQRRVDEELMRLAKEEGDAAEREFKEAEARTKELWDATQKAREERALQEKAAAEQQLKDAEIARQNFTKEIDERLAQMRKDDQGLTADIERMKSFDDLDVPREPTMAEKIRDRIMSRLSPEPGDSTLYGEDMPADDEQKMVPPDNAPDPSPYTCGRAWLTGACEASTGQPYQVAQAPSAILPDVQSPLLSPPETGSPLADSTLYGEDDPTDPRTPTIAAKDIPEAIQYEIDGEGDKNAGKELAEIYNDEIGDLKRELARIEKLHNEGEDVTDLLRDFNQAQKSLDERMAADAAKVRKALEDTRRDAAEVAEINRQLAEIDRSTDKALRDAEIAVSRVREAIQRESGAEKGDLDDAGLTMSPAQTPSLADDEAGTQQEIADYLRQQAATRAQEISDAWDRYYQDVSDGWRELADNPAETIRDGLGSLFDAADQEMSDYAERMRDFYAGNDAPYIPPEETGNNDSEAPDSDVADGKEWEKAIADKEGDDAQRRAFDGPTQEELDKLNASLQETYEKDAAKRRAELTTPLRELKLPSTRYDPYNPSENAGNGSRDKSTVGKYTNKPVEGDPRYEQIATIDPRLKKGTIVIPCNGDRCLDRAVVVGDGGGKTVDLTNKIAREIGCNNCQVTLKVLQEGFPVDTRAPQLTYDKFTPVFERVAQINAALANRPPPIVASSFDIGPVPSTLDWSAYQSPPLDLSSNMPTFVRDSDWTATTDWDSYVRSWAPEQDLSYDIPAPPRTFTPPANYDDYDTSAFPAVVDSGAPAPAIDWSLYEDAYEPPYDPGASFAKDYDEPIVPTRIISEPAAKTMFDTPTMFDVDGSGDWADRFRTPEDDAKYPASLDTTSDIPPLDDPSFPERDLAQEERDRAEAQKVREEYEKAGTPETPGERLARAKIEAYEASVKARDARLSVEDRASEAGKLASELDNKIKTGDIINIETDRERLRKMRDVLTSERETRDSLYDQYYEKEAALRAAQKDYNTSEGEPAPGEISKYLQDKWRIRELEKSALEDGGEWQKAIADWTQYKQVQDELPLRTWDRISDEMNDFRDYFEGAGRLGYLDTETKGEPESDIPDLSGISDGEEWQKAINDAPAPASQKDEPAPLPVPEQMLRDADAARRSADDSARAAAALRAEAAERAAEAVRLEEERNTTGNPAAIEDLTTKENAARSAAEELNRRATELDEMAQAAREREKDLSDRAEKLIEAPADVIDKEDGDMIRARAANAEKSRLEEIADSARRVARDWLWGDDGPLPVRPEMPPVPIAAEKEKTVEPAPALPPVDPLRVIDDRTKREVPPPPLVRAGARSKTLWDWYRETNTPFKTVRERSALYSRFGLLNTGEVYRGTKRQNQRLLQYLQTL